MLKKIVQGIILIVTLGAFLFGIYQNPEIFLEEETQEQLLEIADRIDQALEDISEDDVIVEEIK